MGDWFEVIADVEAAAEEAGRLAADILAWLVERGIVTPEQTDCTLGGLGYAPGPNYTAAVTEPDANLHRLRTNGLRLITSRTVFHSMGVDRVVCPRCGAVVDDQDDELSWTRFSASIDDWYAGGSGIQACERCGEEEGLNDWHWSPPWGFGYLGFEFWNWPMLNPDFIAEVSARLGHRTVAPCGKV